MSPRRLTHLLAACAAGTALALCSAAAASAATSRSTSSNWAGYAVSKAGTRFRHVSATWVQPAVECSQGAGTYSSVWVGLGGSKGTSNALEQIGTEADCSASGRATYSSWYELVPDTSHGARIAVHAGDQIHAGTAVSGTKVTLTIKNLTRGTSFTKVLRAAAVDVSSAEWIVEAPSLCATASSNSCMTSPLAAFGTMTFTGAGAVSTAGHSGTVADPAWHATAIDLAVGGGRGARFADLGGRGGAPGGRGGAATTGELDAAGGSFAVTYASTAPAVSGSDPAGTAPSPVAAPRR